MRSERKSIRFCPGWHLAVMLLLTFPAHAQQVKELLQYVDPFIGTSVSDVPTRWGNEGGCYPGAVAVSGFFQLTPETRHAALSGYDYRDSVIFVFSCLHHNSGYPGGSAGNLYVMPLRPDSGFHLFESKRPFVHSQEKAEPGYYRVRLTDDSTEVEATATTRTGLFRIRFPKGVAPRVFIGDAGEVSLTDDSTLSGGRLHLLVQFNRRVLKSEKTSGGIILVFEPEKAGTTGLVLRLSASSVGPESSMANLKAEAPSSLSFDSLRQKTAEAWQKIFSVAGINDPDTVAKKIFYTALYHSLLLPWIISDVNGDYRGHDGQTHRSSGKAEYGNFSPWDTYRTLHPLRAFLFPDLERDAALSIYDIFLQTGRLPVESMTGNHAIAILADDYSKGLLPVDKEKLFRALQSNVTDSPFVQRDMAAYLRDGYLPAAWPESVTRTVEYGYDDWVLAEYAGTVMRDRAAQKKYLLRSLAYQKLFDPATSLLLPKEKSGFLAHAGTTGYKEGDAWVYTYSVPQDTKGLSNLMGGDAFFVRNLDSALESGRVYFDNETVFHVPWLFNEAGAPQATQFWITRLRAERFKATPGGLPGNDDLGSTSSWYLWSALGFYPLTPGRPLYTITSPLFREIDLHLAGGKTLTISRDSTGFIIDGIRRNNQPFNALTVTHDQLMEGGGWYFQTRKSGFFDRTEMLAVKKDSTGNGYPFSETKTGSGIRIGNLHLSKKTVHPDESFRIRFTAVNKGARGSARIDALDGDYLLGTTTALLDSSQTINGEILCRAYSAGIRTIRIGQQQLLITVILPKKVLNPGYRISGLRTRPVVRQGGGQVYSFRFQNTGGTSREFAVPIELNDSVIDTFRENIAAGGIVDYDATISTALAGENRVRVGNESCRFRVYRSAPESVLMDLKWIKAPGTKGKDAAYMHDRSGLGNNGKPVTTTGKPAQWNKEPDGVSVGNGAYVSIPSAQSLDVMDSNLTMMAWIRPGENADGLADIFSKGDHHVLQLAGAGQLTFFAGGWGRGDCTIRLPGNWVGRWHHVAGVCQGRWLRLYVDGVEAGSTFTDEPVNLSIENHWNLGRNEEFPGVRMFSGSLNFVRVYADALSATEIRSEMERERPEGYPGPDPAKPHKD